MKVSLTEVVSVTLPRSVVTRTHAHLAAAGMRGLEGMALWAGVQDGQVFNIREVIIPEQVGDGDLKPVPDRVLARLPKVWAG